MNKFTVFLCFLFASLQTETFAQTISCSVQAEKTYSQGTRICYFETDKMLSDVTKTFLTQEAERNEKIMRLTFFDDNRQDAMFESTVDFTVDSVTNVINGILAANPQMYIEDTRPQRYRPAPSACGDSTMQPFCTEIDYEYPAETGYSNFGAAGCLDATPGATWFWMKVSDTGNININIYSIDNKGTSHDVDFICWGPYASLDEACSLIDLDACTVSAPGGRCPNNTGAGGDPNFYPSGHVVDCSYSNSSQETCHIPTALHGEIYVLVITNYDHAVTNIHFQQTGGSGSTDCSIVPTLYNNSPLCVGDTLELSANTVTDATYHWTGPNGFDSNEQNPTIPNVTLDNAGTYYLTVTNSFGKASDPYPSEVVINAPDTTYIYDTICQGGKRFFDGDSLYEAGLYYQINKNTYDCDSVVVLNLFVDSCHATFNINTDICADDPSFNVQYSVPRGKVKCVSASFPPDKNWDFTDIDLTCDPTDNTLTFYIPQYEYPNYVRPGTYYAEVYLDCGDDGIIIENMYFTVLYPSRIVKQKWNDVLALLNQNYNGGYVWSSYEWYKDNAKIGGANGSYLYVGADGSTLDFSAKYRARITRVGENEPIFTCAITPEQTTSQTDFPTIVDRNTVFGIKMQNSGTATIISVSGIVISRQNLQVGDNDIQTPSQQGFYIMIVEEKDQNPVKQIMVVK